MEQRTRGDETAGYRDAMTGEPKRAATAVNGQPDTTTPRELKHLLGIVVAAITVAALYFGRDVLIPIMLAVMLSFILSPLVNRLQRLRLWRGPAVMIAVLVALGIVGLIGTLIGSQASSLAANAPQYARTIEAKIEGVQSYATKSMSRITNALESARPRSVPQPAGINQPSVAPSTATAHNGGERRPMQVEMAPQPTSPFTLARTIVSPVLGPLETTFIVLIVAIFVLMQKEDLRDRFIRVFGANDLHRTTLAMNDAGQRLSKYFLSQLAVNTGFGIMIGVGLWLIGIPSPAMWGILAGLLRFVPYIGSLIAAVAPVALAAAIDPGWTSAIYVAALFVVVEPLTGYVVEPLLYGHSTGLSPVSVIVSAIFWTWIWGPIGLIMSTPLTLCLVVMGRHVKSLEFFDIVLGDRPALSPTESFYQRILANSPDEALAQAEQMLGHESPAAYYDEVVVGALRLAAADQMTGRIDRNRAVQINRTLREVIEDLEDHVHSDAPAAVPGSAGARSVCVAGRGPFDIALATLLAQLLRREGYDVRLLPHTAVARDSVVLEDLREYRTIVLAYVDLARSDRKSVV